MVTVQRGSITETVSVTGNTTSTRNVDLGFQSVGTIAGVNAALGQYVSAGQVLASLNTADLRAQLAQAQATVDAEQAKLDKLIAGPRSEDVAVSETALATARQNLANTYAGIQNTIADADTKTTDSVVNQLAPFFTNPQSSNPQLSFPINDSQLTNNIQAQRVLAGKELTVWQSELGSPDAALPPSTLDQLLQNAQRHIAAAQTLLGQASQALVDAANLPASTLTAYKTAAVTGLNEVNAAATEISNAIQTVAAQKAAVAQAQAQLNLTSASSTTQDVEAQRAQVEQAQANVQSIEAKIVQASIVAPINGVVTAQNAKIGQTASPGAPLISILGT
ncbi:MAG: biotin/lipoyl-binding protein, partial [Cyanobacteria bacterium REEB65]|nr:biotin/lipoyl-binding protein [Cyanobacteria bacterium REEB65]